MVIAEMRVCTNCREPKPIEQFDRNGRYRRRRCSPCDYRAAKGRPRGACACGRPKLSGRGHRYCEECSAARAHRRRRLKAEASRRSYEANPAPFIANATARHARLRGVQVGVVSRAKVWERDEGVCGICGEAADPADWHMDHVVPLALGGEHSMANVQVSHPLCNARKGARVAA